MSDGTERLRAAFQGERGAFSEDAALRLIGNDIVTIPCRSFDEIFAAASSGEADCCVVPIENSLAGSVHRNYDLLEENDLSIIDEINLRIVHNLIAPRGVRLGDLKTVYSHPVALAQCERFLRANPHLSAAAAYDTAGSVKMVVESGSRDAAGIAGASAASVYGADILAEGIEDNEQNFTRFLLLTRSDRVGSIRIDPGGRPVKTSILFRVANVPGALFRSLAAFALRDINLLKLESRPIEGRPWEYSFYLDFRGGHAEPAVARALAHLGEMAESIRVLGSYPSSE
ncbi:MAG TPA: prephenate dehydratase [Blastocatellia bacterium]|nr:prephenate dehydratase [Blastocatellia bacterium]